MGKNFKASPGHSVFPLISDFCSVPGGLPPSKNSMQGLEESFPGKQEDNAKVGKFICIEIVFSEKDKADKIEDDL